LPDDAWIAVGIHQDPGDRPSRDESAPRRRKIAAAVADLQALHVIVVGRQMDPSRQERARRKCLERLLHLLAEAQVERVVLESRSPRLNAADGSLVDMLRVRNAIPAMLRISTERPETEPLLWVADAVAGAIRMAVVGTDGHHLDTLAAKTEIVELRV